MFRFDVQLLVLQLNYNLPSLQSLLSTNSFISSIFLIYVCYGIPALTFDYVQCFLSVVSQDKVRVRGVTSIVDQRWHHGPLKGSEADLSTVPESRNSRRTSASTEHNDLSSRGEGSSSMFKLVRPQYIFSAEPRELITLMF